jgi:hypothetical protein
VPEQNAARLLGSPHAATLGRLGEREACPVGSPPHFETNRQDRLVEPLGQDPELLAEGESVIYTADIVYEGGQPGS